MNHTQHPRTLRAALIDMDGTLYDSMPSHAAAWMKMTAEQGLEATPDEFFRYEGMTGAAIIDMLMRRSRGRAATPDEMRELYAAKSRYFSAMPQVPPIDGAVDLINALHCRGIITVLVTGSGQASLIDRLERDFPGAFPASRCVTSASVSRGKPAPDPFLRGLELAGVGPGEAFAIDNAPLGVRSAHDAELLTVGVVTGPLATAELAAEGAHIIYNSMRDCADLLPRLLDKIDDIARR